MPPRRCALAGGSFRPTSPSAVFGLRPGLVTTPARPDFRLRPRPPCAPLDIPAAFCYVVVAGRFHGDGRGDDELFGAGLQRAGVGADRRGRAGLSGLEPDGAGSHGVRVAAVAAPERAAEGAGVPGVSGAARRGGRRGAAGQAPGPRRRFGHARARDDGGRAGAPAGRQRGRRRAAAGSSWCASRPSGCCSGSWWVATTTWGTGSRSAPTCAIWCTRRGLSGRLSGVCSSRARRGAWRRGTAGWAGTIRLGRGTSSAWSTTAASCCCRGSR